MFLHEQHMAAITTTAYCEVQVENVGYGFAEGDVEVTFNILCALDELVELLVESLEVHLIWLA